MLRTDRSGVPVLVSGRHDAYASSCSWLRSGLFVLMENRERQLLHGTCGELCRSEALMSHWFLEIAPFTNPLEAKTSPKSYFAIHPRNHYLPPSLPTFPTPAPNVGPNHALQLRQRLRQDPRRDLLVLSGDAVVVRRRTHGAVGVVPLVPLRGQDMRDVTSVGGIHSVELGRMVHGDVERKSSEPRQGA